MQILPSDLLTLKDKPIKILVRANNWLGDAVMSTPSLGVLRSCFPRARIHLLANPAVAEIFKAHPWVDEVLVIDSKDSKATQSFLKKRFLGLLGHWRLAKLLRSYHFDVVFIFPFSFTSAFAPWLAQIPRRIGYIKDARGWMLTQGVPGAEMDFTRHESHLYLHLLRRVGVIQESPPSPQLNLEKSEILKFQSRLEKVGIRPEDWVLGLNPGAAYGSAKRWLPERFAAVAYSCLRQIQMQNRRVKIVITGGSQEKDSAQEIIHAFYGLASLDERQLMIDFVGQTTVRELMALITRCNMFVTNDSGPMHLSATLATPTVAVFGSTNDRATFPLSVSGRAVVVKKTVDCSPCMKRECPIDHRCMTAIQPQDVMEAILKLNKKIDEPPSFRLL